MFSDTGHDWRTSANDVTGSLVSGRMYARRYHTEATRDVVNLEFIFVETLDISSARSTCVTHSFLLDSPSLTACADASRPSSPLLASRSAVSPS